MAKLSNFWMSQFSMDICGRFMVGEPPLPQGGFISGSLILPGKSTHGDHQEWVSAGWNVERRGANVCFNKNHPTNGPAVTHRWILMDVMAGHQSLHFFSDKSHTFFAHFSGVFLEVWWENLGPVEVRSPVEPHHHHHRPSSRAAKRCRGGKSSTLDPNNISPINRGLFGAPAVLLVV